MSEPRGLAINNPTNIRIVKGQTWVGQTPLQADKDFVSFRTPEYGYRAAKRIIMNHYVHGLTTVASVITHWAPPNENNTAAYIAAVDARLGVKSDTPLDLPAQLPELLHAITIQEQGCCPYADNVIVAGIELDGTHDQAPAAATPPPAAPAPPPPPPQDAEKQFWESRAATAAKPAGWELAAAGALKSRMMHFGFWLAVASWLQVHWPAIGAAVGCNPQSIAAGGTLIGGAVMCLRSITRSPLAAKGLSFFPAAQQEQSP